MQNEHMPGNAIARGPMTGDHYTQIHNLLLRGQVIPTQYVGVWGYIASHAEGWKLTEAKLGKDLNKGRAFIQSALAAIEAAHCLIREQRRDENGKLGDSTWFITDLPLQLRQLDVFDEATIQTKVAEAFAKWKNGQLSTSKSLKLGKARTEKAEENPSAAPMSGYPTSESSQRSTDVGFPVDGSTDVGLSDVGLSDVGQPSPKKNKDQEDQGSEKTNSSSSPPHDSAADDTAGTTEEEEEALDPSEEPIELRTAAGDTREDALTKFWSRLPNKVKPNSHQRAKLDEEVWTLLTPRDKWGDTEDGPARLAARIEGEIPPEGVKSASAWLRNRLANAVGGPPEDDKSSDDAPPTAVSEAERQRAREEFIDQKVRNVARRTRPAGSGPVPGEYEPPF